jgi:hypothetical protein
VRRFIPAVGRRDGGASSTVTALLCASGGFLMPLTPGCGSGSAGSSTADNSPLAAHTWIAFIGPGDGHSKIFTIAAAGGSPPKQITDRGWLPPDVWPPAWSPDGTKIVYGGPDNNGAHNLFMVSSLGGASTQITSGAQQYKYQPAWSPFPN